ncbi:AsmA family protein [Halorhodospira halophila]|uniref:AsmA family protein n=1 Tax=Halorhodospira halophila (strain DSM 244 / SL1) TaxID=349124 RepID=A1WWN7_HALHL|nr:AsmA family protein [Halorhodospira halophila]ABM62099.1 AsmA family protein [Halorhodospira halophila SL1]MBK1729427.1 hypothetical protein [Halorhodospira halophila]
MLRLLKWLLLILLALIVTLGVAIAVVATVIDPNDYRDDLAELAERELGRELEIEGEIEWSFFPWLGIEIGRVTLADAEGYYDEPFVEIDRLSAAVQVWPLLRGELHTRAVELERPIVRLMRDEDGRDNWADLAERFAAAEDEHEDDTAAQESADSESPAQDSPADLEALGGIVIGGLRLHEGAVYWEDRSEDRQIQLDPLNLEVDTLRLDEPVGVRADVLVGDEERVAFSGEARLSQTDAGPEIAASWTLDPLDPKGLLQALGEEPPETTDPEVMRSLSGSGTIDATAERIDVTRLILDLDDSRVEAQAAIEPEQPTIEFAAQLDRIDLDGYLPPEAAEGEANGNGNGETATANDNGGPEGLGDLREVALDFPLEPLRPLILDGRVGIGELRAADLTVTDFEALLSGADGELGAESLQAHLYEGELAGHAWLDARDDDPAFDVAASLEGVAFAPLLEDLLGRDWLHGTGQFHFEGSGGGPHLHGLIEDFDGSGHIAAEDGNLLGLNIPHKIREAAAQLRREDSPEPPGDAERTDFSDLTASFTLEDGVARNDDLLLESPLLDATGEGSADILAEEIDYRVRATFPDGLSEDDAPLLYHLAGATVPLEISGFLFDPDIRLDLAAALGEERLERLGAAREEFDERVDEERERLEQKAQQERERLEQEAKQERERLEREAQEQRDDAERRLREELESFF